MPVPLRRHLSYLMSGMRAGRSTREILQAAAPIALAVFVFGASFGALAVAAHLPAWPPVLMSLLAQLSMEESYAMSGRAGAPGRPDGRTLLVTGPCLYAVWVAGTLIGALFGPVLGDPKRFGLDAAFPAGFVALLWPLLSRRHAVRCAIAGAVAALVLAPFTPPGIPLAGAALVGLWLARQHLRWCWGAPAFCTTFR